MVCGSGGFNSAQDEGGGEAGDGCQPGWTGSGGNDEVSLEVWWEADCHGHLQAQLKAQLHRPSNSELGTQEPRGVGAEVVGN